MSKLSDHELLGCAKHCLLVPRTGLGTEEISNFIKYIYHIEAVMYVYFPLRIEKFI